METQRRCPQCQKPLGSVAPEGLCPECLLKAGLGSGADLGAETQDTMGQARFIAPSVEQMAGLFPALQILGLIGQGGMGAVYKAQQKQLDRVVALKILPPEVGLDTAFAERFTREARALAKLNHPGIVTLFEFGQADGLFFFLMEFVDGANLQQLLQKGRLSPREALAIVPQICDALQYAHDQGIVHRDIKPENILLDRQGRVKVADFGLAKLVGLETSGQGVDSEPTPSGSITESGKVMGTPHYIAPEQFEHPEAVDRRADIYSLGVVFYQMLTGELPGKALEPPSARGRGLRIDVRLDEVVLRALENDPARRYQQASEVKSAVETVAQTAPTTPRSPTPPPRKGIRVRRALLSGAAVFLLMFLSTLILTFSWPETYTSSAKFYLAASEPGTMGSSFDEPQGIVQTELELMQSSRVLTHVIGRLRLAERWTPNYSRGNRLNTPELMRLLREKLKFRYFTRSDSSELILVQASSASPAEAAEIGKAVAKAYLEIPERSRTVKLLEEARPPLQPNGPNRFFLLVLGILAAFLLGAVATGLMLLYSLLRSRKSERETLAVQLEMHPSFASVPDSPPHYF